MSHHSQENFDLCEDIKALVYSLTYIAIETESKDLTDVTKLINQAIVTLITKASSHSDYKHYEPIFMFIEKILTFNVSQTEDAKYILSYLEELNP